MLGRRSFLAATGGAAIFSTMTVSGASSGDIPERPLGRSGVSLPLVGLDGRVISHGPEQKTKAVLDAAVEQGITFFDTAQGHMDGRVEIRYGKLLVPQHRDRIFLQSRTKARSKRVAEVLIDLSLSRLKTDRLDSFLLETGVKMEPEAFEALIRQRKEGKVRFVGLHAQKDTGLAASMLKTYGAEVDLVMLPYGVKEDDKALQLARKLNVGIVADIDRDAQKRWQNNKAGDERIPKELTSWVLEIPQPKSVTSVIERAKQGALV